MAGFRAIFAESPPGQRHPASRTDAFVHGALDIYLFRAPAAGKARPKFV